MVFNSHTLLDSQLVRAQWCKLFHLVFQEVHSDVNVGVRKQKQNRFQCQLSGTGREGCSTWTQDCCGGHLPPLPAGQVVLRDCMPAAAMTEVRQELLGAGWFHLSCHAELRRCCQKAQTVQEDKMEHQLVLATFEDYCKLTAKAPD